MCGYKGIGMKLFIISDSDGEAYLVLDETPESAIQRAKDSLTEEYKQDRYNAYVRHVNWLNSTTKEMNETPYRQKMNKMSLLEVASREECDAEIEFYVEGEHDPTEVIPLNDTMLSL